jgi:tetratricopeptide (TPR) repeat protein
VRLILFLVFAFSLSIRLHVICTDMDTVDGERDGIVEKALYHFNYGNYYHYSSHCYTENIPQFECLSLALGHFLESHRLVSSSKASNHPFNYEGVLNDIGAIYLRLGQVEEAANILDYLLTINPNHVNGLGNLASIQKSLGNYEHSRSLFEKVVKLDSENAQNFYNYGILLQKLQQPESAKRVWERAVSLDPSLHVAYANLASLACGSELSSKYYADGVNASIRSNNAAGLWSVFFQKAVAQIPVITQNSSFTMTVRQQLSQELVYLMKHSPSTLDLTPFDLVGCGSLGYYAIYHGYEDMYIRGLVGSAFWKLSRPSLRYTAEYLKTSEVSLLSANSISMARIRVGFLSSYWFHHSVGLLLRGVIKNIDRKRFDVYLLHIRTPEAVWALDYLTEDLALSDLKYIALSGPLQVLHDEISALKLDVLVFGELGMDATTYFLSFARLARRSVVFWGHAVTSGINTRVFDRMNDDASIDDSSINICAQYPELCNRHPHDRGTDKSSTDDDSGPDYFISSVLFESQGIYAQLEYSERLLLFEGMTTYFYRPPSPLDSSDIANASINSSSSKEKSTSMKFLDYLLASDKSCDEAVHVVYRISCNETRQLFRSQVWHVYAIPQTLYKLRPDFDMVIESILELDDQAIIALPRGNDERNIQQIYQRWQAAGFVDSHRILLLRNMNEREFLTFCAIADVILDPWPVGGGRSSLEIFSTSTPIIVFYSPAITTSILQLTLGMYKTMGDGLDVLRNSYGCCVADSLEAYVAMAINLASNHTLNDNIRSMIRRSNYRLYENTSVIEEWNAMLAYVSQASRPQPEALSYSEIKQGRGNGDIMRRLYTNPLWLSAESNHAVFAYAEPAILLREQLIEKNDRETMSSSVFNETFRVKDFQVNVAIVSNDADWIGSCLSSFEPYHEHIFLEAMFACVVVGKFGLDALDELIANQVSTIQVTRLSDPHGSHIFILLYTSSSI